MRMTGNEVEMLVDKPQRSPSDSATLRRIPHGMLVAFSLGLLLTWLLPGQWSHAAVFPLWLHTMAEMFSVVVALSIFGVAWNAWSVDRPSNIVVLACGFLAVGLLDIGHLMSYPGMPDFITPSGTEKGINFWLLARYTASGSLLAIALHPWTRLQNPRLRYGLLTASLAFVVVFFIQQLFFPSLSPRTFIPGQGLTPLKVASEYGVIMVSTVAAWLLYRETSVSRTYDAANLYAAAVMTIVSELCMTLYASVTDSFMMFGHVYKIIAYFYIYRAIFVTSVREPYRRLNKEIEERRAAEHMLDYLAYHDALTGLPNRQLLRDRVEQAIVYARHAEAKVALLFLDLDNFKAINDSLGHDAGDALVKEVGVRLMQCARISDTVSRLGGDEFVVLVPDLHDSEAVVSMPAKLLAQLVAPMSAGGQEIVTSASMGIALFPDDGGDFDTLLKKAEIAMYRAKEAGRNTYRFFDEQMNTGAAEHLRITTGLRRALENRELVLHYQPQVDIRSRQLIGAEALLRWNHPELGLLPPTHFIPVAEESGMIVPIGEWVVHEACRQAAEWHRSGSPVRVAVNLSSVQFKRGDVEAIVLRALDKSGLDPSLLELELTESILIQDTESVLMAVRRLKSLGVKLSIDDFGTGYSSLSYLKRFAVDRIKIDRSFIRDLSTDKDDEAIVRAVIDMAHSLGLRVIAEGVEDAWQVEHLCTLQCDEVQGFHFGKPMPAEAFQSFAGSAAIAGM